MIFAIFYLAGISKALEWNTEVILDHSGIGSDCDLVIDEAGGIHVCFHYKCNSLPGADLYYAFKADAVSSWEITPVDQDYSNVVGANCEIDLDLQGHPHISYIYDWAIEDLSYIKYAAFDGLTWSTEQLTFSPEYSSDGTSIVMFNDNPHIFYYKFCSGLTHQWKDPSDNWVTETLDSAYIIMHSHAAMDSSGSIGIAYFRMATWDSEWELCYAEQDGISWQLETAFSGNPCDTYRQLDMVYDLDNNPHITFIASQATDDSSLLLHTWHNGTAWETDNLGTISSGIYSFPSIAVDNSNSVHIVYGERPYTDYNGTLHHISDESDTWVDAILLDTINPWNSAIEIDSYDQPHIISYADGITRHLWRTDESHIEGSFTAPVSGLLSSPHPNPCSGYSSIRYSVTVSGPARLELFDVSGRIIDVIEEGFHHAGEYQVEVTDLVTGIYVFRFTTGTNAETRKLIVL